ncbi:MAG TPA: hypothetical protein VFO07_03520, partial [Roseiflexaceae bacterium]|nr:hypothetical protein [Roseiflexaceae bacterium]
MTIESLQSQLDAFDQAALYERDNFQGRAEVIDAIEFEIIDRIDGLLGYPSQPRQLRSLRRAAEGLQRRLVLKVGRPLTHGPSGCPFLRDRQAHVGADQPAAH